MKTKITFIFGVISLLLVGCVADKPYSEVVFDADVSSSTAEKSQPIVFTDYSEGVVSRVWTFPFGVPATSTDKEVIVSFSQEGPITCSIVATYQQGFTESKDINIQIGNEQYARGVFGFEDSVKALEAWKYWVSNGTDAVKFSIDKSQGANGTSSCAKIEVLIPGVEIQLYTKGNAKPINAVLKSDTAYTFSFWIKSETLTSLEAAEVSNQSDAQKTFKNYAWWSPVPKITSNWEQKFIEIPAQDIAKTYPAEGQALNAYTQFKFKPTSPGTYYIDEVSLKEVKN
jgi:hypothetical protein